jgi:glycosyltransferase involved in cell wall biosynthesis
MKKNKTISIVTIVFNDKKGLEKTILSVLSQEFNDFEFIIIDGGSTDGTKEVIDKYKDNIDFYISEKDQGIYDAMNKGVTIANGRWLNFMNAGDIFYSSKVLSSIFKEIKHKNKALIYGYKYENSLPIYPHSIDFLKKGILMGNHQSMFFNSLIIGQDLFYSLKYPIYGDYELVNRIFLKHGEDSFKYLNLPIAIYEGGGISSMVSYQKRKDKFKIIFHSYGFIGVLKAMFYSKISKNTKK